MEIVASIARGQGSVAGRIKYINRIIGNGAEDLADYQASDNGEAPEGANWK
jgi:hypothetical protein